MDLSLEELEAEIKRIEGENKEKDDEGKTVTELAEQWGLGKTATTMKLRKLIDAGVCIVGKRAGKRIDGRKFHYPVYRFVEKKCRNQKRTSSATRKRTSKKSLDTSKTRTKKSS